MFVHFLSQEKKTNQKKPPVCRYTLRVFATAGARGNSLRSNSPRTLIRPHRRCSARDKGQFKT
jgi:hypothetical protein